MKKTFMVAGGPPGPATNLSRPPSLMQPAVPVTQPSTQLLCPSTPLPTRRWGAPLRKTPLAALGGGVSAINVLDSPKENKTVWKFLLSRKADHLWRALKVGDS